MYQVLTILLTSTPKSKEVVTECLAQGFYFKWSVGWIMLRIVMSCRAKARHVIMSCYVTSCQVMSSLAVPCHVHVVSCHVPSNNVLSRLNIALCIVFPALSCHVSSITACLFFSCHVVSRLPSRIPSDPVSSCHVMSCHVMSCHVMSCHVMSCHVMSHLSLSVPCVTAGPLPSCLVSWSLLVSYLAASCLHLPCQVLSCRVFCFLLTTDSL